MPLGFRSLSHGEIAFGFFNVKSDMLLLQNNFFFADDFCKQINALEDSCEDDPAFQWNIWHISNPSDMGDFSSVLGEIRDAGFWGELYRQYPFPKHPEKFHQQPDGWKTQDDVTRIMGNYGTQKQISIGVDPDKEIAYIGEYYFNYQNFKELILYVWAGGYPKWQDGKRPEYVVQMKEKIGRGDKPFFKGIKFITP